MKTISADIDKPLFCDTETIGFYGKIRLIQYMQEGWQEPEYIEYPDPIMLFGDLNRYYTVWHNAHYDITTLQQQTNSRHQLKKFDDTFLLTRLAQPQYDTYSLDDILIRSLGFDPYDNLNKKALQKSNWGAPVLSNDQIAYAKADVKYMPELYELVKEKIEDPNYILDKSTLVKCLDFQCNGMPVDGDRLNKKYKTLQEELENIDMPVNANSWQQVRKWLNTNQSDKVHLSKLALMGKQKARDVLDVRTKRKLISFLDKYNKDVIYGKFKPSARSGRLTSDDENLQQIPRALKEIFGVAEDQVIIFSDYPQIELRTICAILQVKVLELLFRDGVDVHGHVASVIFGNSYTKDDRQITKTYNFNNLYGGSVKMILSILITYGFLIDINAASRHRRKWLKLFPEIDSWQQKETAKWRKGKLSSTPFGRQYKGKLMTDQMNIMNQGAGAEVAKLALHYFYPRLEDYEGVKLRNFIHDSYILTAPNDPDIYKPVATLLGKCMQEAWFEMSKLYKIKDLPMPVNVRVGHNWGDIEQDKFIWECNL